MQKFFRLLVPLCVLILGWIGYAMLSKHEEKPKRPEPVARIIKTQVLELQREDFPTVIRTQGVVRPHSEASLTAQVSGKVKSISPNLQDGAFFDKDEVLLEIDDEDLTAGVISAEADLARADAAYMQEEARANQAKLNWEDLGYKQEPNDLVLRLPQLREAEANVKAATATLERAKRDLERTSVRAPFDGRVLTRAVSIGQSISPTSVLAVVFSTDSVEVRLPIAARELAFLDLPEGRDDTPVDVVLNDSLDSESTTTWHGEIVGTEGSLDSSSRELFAIARIDDPFSRKAAPGDQLPPLRIGQPVRATIEGKVLRDVFVIPRSAVRSLDLIYLVDREELTLQRHKIEPIWSGQEVHVIRDPEIADLSLLATTRLAYAPNVARVEILPDSPAGEDGDESEGGTAAAAAAGNPKPDNT
jgi:RND family efflux transporter MFP subunit